MPIRAILTTALLALVKAMPVFATGLAAAEFPTPYNSEQGNPAPLSAAEALSKITLPPGLQATLFAAEPEVQNPIALDFDARGRLWVAENYTYAERALRFDLKLRDRILIFDDTDVDGRADSRKVFADTLQPLTSIARVPGGVWAMCPPQLVFIPDADGDDVPDGPPVLALDGFTVAKENYHGLANGLKIGPDGWLYGRCGASCPGDVGVPGTPSEKRVPMRGGLWRYHPQRQVFEALTHGTTNPWGHDWDAHGELFFVNTVNGHLWHMIPGAHYVRSHTLDPHPHSYALIDTHADHWHFDTGKSWTASRDGAANQLGGGHSHEGALIYQGGNWPAEYRGKLLTINFHGRRINAERLERRGSGYVAKHEPDPVTFGDSWFRGVDLASGPDGGVYVLDWSDTGECHEHTGVHRTSGRIFKITAGQPQKAALTGSSPISTEALLRDLRAENIWIARQALLAVAASGGKRDDVQAALRGMFKDSTESVPKLRALWALWVAGGASETWLRERLQDADEHVRVWAIRLLTDTWPLDLADGRRPARPEPVPAPGLLAELSRLARQDSSDLVRLALASTLQRLPVADRAALAAPLLARAEDADDHNLPLLVWYGLTPLGESDPAALVRLAADAEWPIVRRFIARRVAVELENNPTPLNALLNLAATKPLTFQSDAIAGLGDAFTGWRKAPKPAAWDAVSAQFHASLSARVRELSTLFGDGRALEEVQRTALDPKTDLAARKLALQTLVAARVPDLRIICESLLSTRILNTAALGGLAQESDPAIGAKLLENYPSFSPDDRPQVIGVLATRPSWAAALLDAVATYKIPRVDLSAFHARQIRDLNDAALTALLTEVWGELRDSAESKRTLIARLKSELTPAVLAGADASQGRQTYSQLCAACHQLYGEGGRIGPDLTGSGRDNLDYLLENIIDPSAVVTADFRLSTLTLRDGRVLAGFIASKTDRTLTLRTMTDTQTLERAEVVGIVESAQSMMPEGMLDAFTTEQIRDLFGYLMSRQQVPLPANN